MTKFLISKFKILLTIFLVLSISSCAKKEDDEEVDVDQGSQFFNIVYITQAVRIVGDSAWVRVEGSQRIKFSYAEGEENNTSIGDFIMQYANYKEPVLFNNTLCSGGYSGGFTLEEILETSNPCETCPYNPLDDYDSGTTEDDGSNTTVDPETGEEIVSNYTFLFTMTVDARSFTSGCSQVNPQDSFQLRVIRFPNGDLVVTNASRTLEFYFTPELL